MTSLAALQSEPRHVARPRLPTARANAAAACATGPPLPPRPRPATLRSNARRSPRTADPGITLAARYVRVVLTCWSCRHQRDADLQGLVDAGRGDVPLIHLRWRCSQCRSARIDMICTSHARVQPRRGL